jgi:hypothetical protein
MNAAEQWECTDFLYYKFWMKASTLLSIVISLLTKIVMLLEIEQ